jgi:pimeloyl-ACP methyl ester carboxylesterase
VLAIIACIIAAAELQAAAPKLPTLHELTNKTLGGNQFWADEHFFHQWRIQRNVFDDHCRLLDEKNVRYASGTFAQCLARLEEIKRERRLPPMRGEAVIVMHGLFRTRSSMDKLCTHLRQQGGYTVLNVGYPSTRREVGAHARALAKIVDGLEGIDRVSFVAHSMGNIVIRHYLGDRNAAAGGGKGPRPTRFVMLAPPNQGSLTALALAENNVLKVVTGDAVRQLGLDWDKLQDRLAVPDFEFGIIAGGKGDDSGYNSLLPGDDDGTVSVASTRLAGARDSAVVPVLHSFIMNDAKVHQYTLRFLKTGRFGEGTD